MASENVFTWIERNQSLVTGNILEVGSKRYKDHATIMLRERFGAVGKYLGCDLESGENVDKKVDLAAPFSEIENELGENQFKTIFCISVLEHVPNIFQMAQNLIKLMAPSGVIFISVPFVFRIHGYPGDYWRFTPQAIKYLFADLTFDPQDEQIISTLESNDLHHIGRTEGKINRFIFRPKSKKEREKRKNFKKVGIETSPYSMAPCMINLIGRKGDH